MSAHEPFLLPLEDALARLAGAVPSPAWPGIRADRDDPATDRSTMDGLAVWSGDGRAPRRVRGTLFAGQDPRGHRLGPGEGWRVMTGACIPEGADAVVPVERLGTDGDTLVPDVDPAPGDFILPQGSQAHSGDGLLGEGGPMTAARVGLMAQVGAPHPHHLRRVRVGIAPTGDELVQDPAPWQVRDSNGPMLAALAHRLGAEVRELPRVPDDPLAVRHFFEGTRDLQVIVTAGGVSLGERDHLPRVLQELGASILFHRIRLRPGKPTLAALLGERVVLSLPGNPVSAYLNALLFLPVVLARLEGRALPDPWRACELAEAVPNAGDRPLLHPCRRDGGRLVPLAGRGSADLVRLAQADACVWVPEGGAAAGPARCLDIL